MADITIRQADIRDVDSIYKIEKLCFADPWSYEALVYEFKNNPAAFYVVAESDYAIIGYAGLWWIFDEGHITNVAVIPGFRNRKIASSMMDTLMDHTRREGIRKFTLEVRASNEAAIGLYRKYGFREEGLRKNYYLSNGEDAVIMWWKEE